RIEHAQLARPEDIARCSALGIALSVQPQMLASDRTEATARRGARTAHAYAYRALLDATCHLLFGSDAPIEDIDPLGAMHAAVDRDGGWHAEQALTPAEALAASTSRPLMPGAPADLTVLSAHPLRTPLDEVEVVAAMLAGRWTHGAPAQTD